jgi:site-specific DNA recombinase
MVQEDRPTMKAIIYARVSTKEQVENFSLATQEKVCREYCERAGYDVAGVFVDKGESAKTIDRPEFLRALAFCRESRVDFFVVYALSRFSRKSHDHAIIGARLKAYGTTLRSATEPIDDTATGRLMETMLAGFAQFDNDVKSDRTVAGMKAALSKGRWPWQPPLGYLTGMLPDPERAPLIRRAFALTASGQLRREELRGRLAGLGLRGKHGGPVARQTFAPLLRNPIYAGILRAPRWGIEGKGDFEPLVSEEVFYRAQAVLDGRAAPTVTHLRDNPDFPLRGFVRCDCGAPLTGSWSKGRSKRYGNYRCARPGHVNITKPALERAFTDLLETLKLAPKYHKLFRAIVLDAWAKRHEEAAEAKRVRQKQYKVVEERRERLVAAFVYQQAIDEATYREQLKRLDDEMAVVSAGYVGAIVSEAELKGLLEFAEYVLESPGRVWSEFTLGQRQRFQKIVFPEGLTCERSGRIGTAVTSPVFKYLSAIQDEKACLVAPTGLEPVPRP